MNRRLQSLFCFVAVCASMILSTGCTVPQPRPVRVLMITDDAAMAHSRWLANRLAERGNLEIEITTDSISWSGQCVQRADVFLLDRTEHAPLPLVAQETLAAQIRSGRGFVVLPQSLPHDESPPDWIQLIGGVCDGQLPPNEYPISCLDTAHTVAFSIGGLFPLADSPMRVKACTPQKEILFCTRVPNDPNTYWPMAWIHRFGDGRVLATALGNHPDARKNEIFITLLHNGIRWASRRFPDARHNALTQSEAATGFQLLFNGNDLAGWTTDDTTWSVENEAIVIRMNEPGTDSLLTLDSSYDDFELRLSVKRITGAGGIILRGRDGHTGTTCGLKVDTAENGWTKLYTTEGTLLADGFRNNVEKGVIQKGWNDIIIRASGPRIVVRLNGLRTIDYTAPEVAAQHGLIALQVAGETPAELHFRDIRIRQLDQ